nr:MAG: ORF1 [TTV-like mini virus]
MPPFRFYRRRWRRPYRKRYFNYRFQRPRTYFRRRKRSYWVRKNKLYSKRLKKLKAINIIQYQPDKIRKCKITGYLELFECSYGRVSNNFTTAKESYVPPHEPGGGGWSIQQLTLGNLFTQNQYIMNYWTQSNKGYPLCRLTGIKITLFRQPHTDYIFHYNLEDPFTINKYTYPSYHPFKMLNYNKRIFVPSYDTAPHKKRPYKKRKLKLPKKLTNQWYFQQQFSNIPLIRFFSTAVDVMPLFIPPHAKNNNITLKCLNTRFFQHPAFQYHGRSTTGFSPKSGGGEYIYGMPGYEIGQETPQIQSTIFLGNSMHNVDGQALQFTSTYQAYTEDKWGNPFYFEYLNMDTLTYVTSNTIEKQYTNKTNKVDKNHIKTEPYIIDVRYNPNKDKGTGNIAYFLNTYDINQRNWDPPKDPDLIIQGFPLWLMLWGFEEYIRKLGKISKLDENGILVIRSLAFSDTLPAYVILNETFINGQGPYGVPHAEISAYHNSHWYPRFQFQKEALEEILITGPAVCHPPKDNSIQAHIKYDFFFKWGGNPARMETLADPNSQPIEPTPNIQLTTNEIICPTSNPADLLYTWDIRRDLLTTTAAERIKQIPINEQYVLTDGTSTSTDIPIKTQKTQEETATEKEKETLLRQLNLIQQYNQQLQQRFRQLKTIMQST